MNCNDEIPDSISKPFVAGIESIAWAKTASNLSKQGSPSPDGTFEHTVDITPIIYDEENPLFKKIPPIESFCSLTFWMRSIIFKAVGVWGHLIIFFSTKV